MGNKYGKKIGASILIAVMLLASLGIMGLSVGSVLTGQEQVNSGPIEGLRSVEVSPEVQASLDGTNIPRLTATEKLAPTSAPSPEANSLYPVVDTSRCVLVEFGSGIDNGSFVPSYTYAMDQTMNTYARSEVAPMFLNSWGDTMVNPTYSGWQDWEYSPGDHMFTGGYCDAMVREAGAAPYGLDCFPAYVWPAALDPSGTKLLDAGMWSVDGGVAKYDGSGAFFNDCDSTWDGRWTDSGASGAEHVKPDIDTRLGVPSDFTMTLNGTFDDVTDWGNVSLSVSAINDVDQYDSTAYTVAFWVVDDYNVVESRTNPYTIAGADGPSAKNYIIRNSMQQWMGIDDALDGYLENRGEVISYQDISFNRDTAPRTAPMFGDRNQWNGNELGIIASLYDDTTMNCMQTVYYQFANTQPDLAITPVDIYYDNTVAVVNETSYIATPADVGNEVTFYTANAPLLDLSLYVFIPGDAIYPLDAGADYTVNMTTGEITTLLGGVDAGWEFYTYYNYTAGPPSVGDIVPLDITVDNAGNGIANNVIVGIYDGDPTQGGALIGTQNAGNIAAQSSYNFVYNWDTTGYEGYHSICVIPDHLDAITESNENNNIASYDIYVAPPADVGTVDLLTFNDGQTYEWGWYDIDAQVANYGTTPQGPFDVLCTINHLGSSSYLLNDNCENGILAGWTPDGPAAPGWDLRTNDAHSPTTSWDFGNGNYGAGPFDYKLMYGPFDLSGAYASATWSWWHAYSFEAGWDGGILQVSPDGTTWTDVTSANGYDGALGTGYGNPIEGYNAFTGATTGWVQDSVDLTAYLGDASVWVRYWAGCDNYNGGGTGWTIDDIMIYKTSAPLGELFHQVKTTTTPTMNQWDSEIMTWTYNFDLEAQYTVSVMTIMPGDAVATNNESAATITTANIRAPFPPTDLTSTPGGGSTTFYQQATSDIPVENNGIVNTYVATNMPADAVTEDITEVLNAPAGGTAVANAVGATDTTGDSLADIQVDDAAGASPSAVAAGDGWYTVDKGAVLFMDGFNTAGMSGTVSGATLEVQYSVEAGYGGTNPVQWALDGGALASTGITPVDGQTDFVATYDLFAQGVDTLAKINTLDVEFTSNDGGGPDAVSFDYTRIVVTVSGAAHYALEHQWQFQNVPVGDTHMFYATTGFAGDDNFAYYYSTTGAFAGEEVLMATDTTPGLDQFSYDLGAGYSGAFYVAVRDTDGADTTTADVVSIDEMYVETGITTSVNDLILTWTLSPDDGAGANDVQGYNIYKADAGAGEWYEGPYTLFNTVGAGTNMWTDVGAMLVGTNAWYYVEAFDPAYSSVPTGIVSKTDVMPATSNVLADGVSPWTGPVGTASITLTCNVSDNTTNNEYNTLLTGAEWYDTVDPGVGNGNVIISPVDTAWNGPYESVSEVIDISAWGAGTHTIYVRGNSSTGWGPAVSVDVILTAPPYNIDMVGVVAGDWVFVSYPIDVTGNIWTILDDSVLGDGGTTWDTAKWYNATDPADHWKTYNPSKPAALNDLLTIDNTMGVWLHITANGGDNVLTISQAAGYPAAAVAINLYTGWNLVGFPSGTDQLASATLPAEADMMAVFDAAQPYLVRDVTALNTVTMTNGEAYWVHVTADTVWSVAP